MSRPRLRHSYRSFVISTLCAVFFFNVDKPGFPTAIGFFLTNSYCWNSRKMTTVQNALPCWQSPASSEVNSSRAKGTMRTVLESRRQTSGRTRAATQQPQTAKHSRPVCPDCLEERKHTYISIHVKSRLKHHCQLTLTCLWGVTNSLFHFPFSQRRNLVLLWELAGKLPLR